MRGGTVRSRNGDYVFQYLFNGTAATGAVLAFQSHGKLINFFYQ